MTAPRADHTGTLLQSGKVLVAAGRNYYDYGSTTVYLSSAEIYDPTTAKWTTTGSLNAPRTDHTATLLLNGKVLVAGGYDGSLSGPIELSSAELYDPASGTWTATGSLNTPRTDHTATLLPNGKVLVAGGILYSELSSAELYDPASGTWTATGSLNTARRYHTATSLPNGKVLVAGGASIDTYTSSAELYDPASGPWTATGSLNTARYHHKAALLASGQVLVAAGNGWLASAELYDPATGIWTMTGAMNTPPGDYPAAALLANGSVLIVGGYGADWLVNAELYDPTSGQWNATGSLNTGRELHTATLLANGNVLVAGGCNGGYDLLADFLSSAELYDGPVPSPGAMILANVVKLPGGALQFGFSNTPGGSFSVFGTTNLSLSFTNWTALGAAAEVSPACFNSPTSKPRTARDASTGCAHRSLGMFPGLPFPTRYRCRDGGERVGKPLTAAGLHALRDEYTRTIAPFRALAAETLKLERTLSDLVNQSCAMTPAEIDLMWKTAPPACPSRRPVARSKNADALM